MLNYDHFESLLHFFLDIFIHYDIVEICLTVNQYT